MATDSDSEGFEILLECINGLTTKLLQDNDPESRIKLLLQSLESLKSKKPTAAEINPEVNTPVSSLDTITTSPEISPHMDLELAEIVKYYPHYPKLEKMIAEIEFPEQFPFTQTLLNLDSNRAANLLSYFFRGIIHGYEKQYTGTKVPRIVLESGNFVQIFRAIYLTGAKLKQKTLKIRQIGATITEQDIFGALEEKAMRGRIEYIKSQIQR